MDRLRRGLLIGILLGASGCAGANHRHTGAMTPTSAERTVGPSAHRGAVDPFVAEPRSGTGSTLSRYFPNFPWRTASRNQPSLAAPDAKWPEQKAAEHSAAVVANDTPPQALPNTARRVSARRPSDRSTPLLPMAVVVRAFPEGASDAETLRAATTPAATNRPAAAQTSSPRDAATRRVRADVEPEPIAASPALDDWATPTPQSAQAPALVDLSPEPAVEPDQPTLEEPDPRLLTSPPPAVLLDPAPAAAPAPAPVPDTPDTHPSLEPLTPRPEPPANTPPAAVRTVEPPRTDPAAAEVPAAPVAEPATDPIPPQTAPAPAPITPEPAPPAAPQPEPPLAPPAPAPTVEPPAPAEPAPTPPPAVETPPTPAPATTTPPAPEPVAPPVRDEDPSDVPPPAIPVTPEHNVLDVEEPIAPTESESVAGVRHVPAVGLDRAPDRPYDAEVSPTEMVVRTAPEPPAASLPAPVSAPGPRPAASHHHHHDEPAAGPLRSLLGRPFRQAAGLPRVEYPGAYYPDGRAPSATAAATTPVKPRQSLTGRLFRKIRTLGRGPDEARLPTDAPAPPVVPAPETVPPPPAR